MRVVSARNQAWSVSGDTTTQQTSVGHRSVRAVKAKLGGAARLASVVGSAIVLVLSAQVLVSSDGTAAAASSHQFGVLTDGYDLSAQINPIEFDPTRIF